MSQPCSPEPSAKACNNRLRISNSDGDQSPDAKSRTYPGKKQRRLIYRSKIHGKAHLLSCFSKASIHYYVMKITLEVPDSSLSITRERPEEFARSLRIAAAVKWYELGRISQSKAAELVGCSRIELFNHLRDYGVSAIQVSGEDLEQEVADSRI